MPNPMATPGLTVKKRPALPANKVSHSASSDSLGSSPASFDSDHKAFSADHRAFSLSSLTSIKGRTWRSFSSKDREGTPDGGHSFRTHARRLSKSRPLSSSSPIDPPSRRGSTISDDQSPPSVSTVDSISVTTASSSSVSVDWEAQHVEGSAPLEPDTLLLKTKIPYMVVTSNYLVKTKSRAEAQALFPELAAEGTKHETHGSTPEPMLAIPMDAIISVFAAESTRPSFGFEVWWRSPLAGHSFCRSDFFFTNPTERNEQMHHLTRAMRASQQDENSPARHSQDVKALLEKIHEVEEPRFQHRRPDIFPVVPRGPTRKEYMPKLEDATKKSQEGPAFYLVVGTNLCHLVEIQKGKGGGDPICRHKTYGLVTLESFKGEGILHEERFNITFREPFKAPITLELASRYYRQIIRVFGTADRFIKPAWPLLWQTLEIFRVSGFKEPQYLVPKEDFGSFKRTLDAYLAAYHCEDVDWEINWKTRFAPEFRLLPVKRGSYSTLQLLAVLRALRYNDYFNSLSFRDVDLSVLCGLQDNTLRKVNVAYLTRTCVALGPDEIETLRVSPVLHQEFHALAFCSQTIRQIDFGNCTQSFSSRSAQQRSQVSSLQFLTPILSLMRSGITKCNRLIVSGNMLPQADVDDLAETMTAGAFQALDVSYCGLDDASLREMIVVPLTQHPGLLQSLSVSGNPGRLPAHILPGLLQYLTEIRELNLSGSIQAESYIDGSLLPFAALEGMESLEELDVSGYKIDEATFTDLERFLQYRRWRLDQGQPLRFYKLVLNHCRITGTHAARLFRAIGPDRSMHLSLSGNPIEDGIDDLTAAIRAGACPAGLHLEMIEFKDEPNYLTLLAALTTTPHLTLLSLAGTAPSPSSHGACSDDLVATLHAFFARNTSITCLDLSGFSGKLDDGQLPRGFGRALAGLADNRTLTHLRIRNQNLHDDAGTLGRALAHNGTLAALDCRDNNLNLTSLRFLVDSLQTSPSIVECPFPAAEREAVWRNVLRGLQRTPSSVALPALGTVSAANAASAGAGAGAGAAARELLKREEEALLREVLEGLFARLAERLRVNRAARWEGKNNGGGSGSGNGVVKAGLGVQQRSGGGVGFGGGGVRCHRHQRSASSGLGIGGVFPGEDGWPTVGGEIGLGIGPSRSSSTDSEPGSKSVHRLTAAAGEAEASASSSSSSSYGYQLGHTALRGSGGVGGMESPAETLDTVSEVETPVEEKGQDALEVRVVDWEAVKPASPVEGEGEGDELFRKMINDFRKAGFEV